MLLRPVLTTWALAGLGLWIELRRIQGPGAKGMRYAVGNWEQHYQLAFVGPCLMVLGFLEGSHACARPYVHLRTAMTDSIHSVEGVDGFPNAAIAILFLVGFLDSFVVRVSNLYAGSSSLTIESSPVSLPRTPAAERTLAVSTRMKASVDATS